MKRSIVLAAVIITAILVGSAAVAYAKQPDPVSSENHAWSNYHWARTSNPFTLQLGDNLSTTEWKNDLNTISSNTQNAGWDYSTMLDTNIVPGGTSPKPCKATSGRDEVCNARYGNTGWLGVATIWISGSHITQGTVKVNDYYFGGSNYNYQYNNSAEKLHVMCQEVGHTFGLDHQSTDGSSLNTCMDYYHNTSASDTKSTSPNAGDYDELLCIYDKASAGKTLTSSPHTCTGTGHLDSTSTVGTSTASKGSSGAPNDPRNEPGDNPSQWGKEISRSANGKESIYKLDLGGGEAKVTHVTWTDEQAKRRAQRAQA